MRGKSLLIIPVLLLVFAGCHEIRSQGRYDGEPVKRDNLIRVLTSKKYLTKHIVEIIKENGVDFQATKSVIEELVKAGARPDVIAAVKSNYRGTLKSTSSRTSNSNKYQVSLDEAIRQFDVSGDTAGSIKTLESAIEMYPKKPRAYQLLGFAYLYGDRDFKKAETQMTKSIDLGGSAVFRIIHGHDVSFSFSCTGSLYVSKDNVIFEGDDNEHTFDVSKKDIQNVKTLGGWGKLIRRKGGAFKISIREKKKNKKEEDKEIYNFAPTTGKSDETKMIIKLVGKTD